MAATLLDQIQTESLQSSRGEGDWLGGQFLPDQIVQLQGPSGTGKSSFLYLLIIICVLPDSFEAHRIGGWNQAALLFDTDLSFDAARFKRMMECHIARLGLPSHVSAAVLEHGLSQLCVFRPASTAQLAATLIHLPTYIVTRLPNTALGMIAIDSLSAFHCQDRFTMEQRHTGKDTVHPTAYPIYNVLVALKHLKSTFHPLIVVTNWALESMQTTTANTPVLYRQHLYPLPTLLHSALDQRHTQTDMSVSPATVLELSSHITFAQANIAVEPGIQNAMQTICWIHRAVREPERFELRFTQEIPEIVHF
ncbi:hypothetical protein CYLTODRAFT_440376 [Cylindrobasidium torrendii FP15055 ss-10]|uniref:Uncharacterized protein n=1 Tax=Cylindrobasidium torrendii FP15055 ss-10 TaxID=1314674 RepID=A0A0D7BRK2_9AGAR|nr:hypothetical protein CYLTODRAFT_440376 [Cylindrobasidium torrendii FP15055 ss-10]